MLNNSALLALRFLQGVLFLLAVAASIAFFPIIYPIWLYSLLRADKHGFVLSIMVALALFTILSAVSFVAIIVPLFMPTLAIAPLFFAIASELFVDFVMCAVLPLTFFVIIPKMIWPWISLLRYSVTPSQPSPDEDNVPRMHASSIFTPTATTHIQFIPNTHSAKRMLGPTDFALIKALLAPMTADDPQRQNKMVLRTLSERYVALKDKIDAVERALISDKVLENFDDFNCHGDVTIPVLCVKEYQKDGAWLIVPATSYITDGEFIVDWSRCNMTHPLSRESFVVPPNYVDNNVEYTARYSFYILSEPRCWAAELNESVIKIHELLRQLNPQDNSLMSQNTTAWNTSLSARFF